jgi:BMFP domain-containing protein YqiC
MRLKAVHAVAQAAAAYRALVEATDLEARVEALEAAQASTGVRRAA